MTRRRRVARAPWAGPLGVYTPGNSWLHTLRPGPKFLALLVVSVALTLARDPLVVGIALVVAAALVRVARLPLRRTVRSLLPILVLAGLLGVYQSWARSWREGAVTAGTLVTLVVLATVVTATTRTDRMIDALVRAAEPLRRLGLDPQALALAIALMLRTIPALLTVADDVRSAARARGLERNPRALLVPFALRTVARAHSTGDALAARGILDPADDADVTAVAPTRSPMDHHPTAHPGPEAPQAPRAEPPHAG